MAKKSFTRDEVFLLKLQDLAQQRGNIFCEIDRYEVGKAMGQNNRSVDNIVRMLAQTNFIKKGEKDAVYLTSHGCGLLSSLVENGAVV
jgi:hypothetical protein